MMNNRQQLDLWLECLEEIDSTGIGPKVLNQVAVLVGEFAKQATTQGDVARLSLNLQALVTALNNEQPQALKQIIVDRVLPLVKAGIKQSGNESVTQNIVDQYSDYMYPDDWRGTVPESILEIARGRGKNVKIVLEQGAFYNVDYIQHRAFPEWIPHNKLTVLNAGCGTGESLIMTAMKYPQVQFTGVDICMNSLTRAAQYIDELGVTNIELVHGNLMELQLGRQFDIIQSSGVIHHLESPLAGMVSLKKHLKPHGAIALFVYGDYGRFEIALFQEAVKLLQIDPRNFPEGIRIVREVVDNLPENSRLREMAYKKDIEQGDNHIVDLLLNANEYRYTIKSLSQLVENAGLQISGFFAPKSHDPAYYIDSPYIAAKAKYLSLVERAYLTELLGGRMVKQKIFCSHPDNIAAMPHIDDKRAADYVPHLSPYFHAKMAENESYQLVAGYAFLFEDQRVIDKTKVITIDKAIYTVVEKIDGVKTCCEVHASLDHISWQDYWLFMRALVDNDLVYLHKKA